MTKLAVVEILAPCALVHRETRRGWNSLVFECLNNPRIIYMFLYIALTTLKKKSEL